MYMFAHLREIFQEEREIELELKKSTWSSSVELKSDLLHLLNIRWLHRQGQLEFDHPLDVQPGTLMLVINEKFVDTDDVIHLKEGYVLALIPPVSGG